MAKKKPNKINKTKSQPKPKARRAGTKKDKPLKALTPEIVEPAENLDVLPIEGEPVDVEALQKDDDVATNALVTSDPVSRYMAEVRKYKLLTRNEERELAIKYFETKDASAAERLVTANLRFVVKIALEYAKFGAKLIDLIQEGNVGLMHAVREYDPYRDVRLITYAVWWIRGYIQEYLMKQYSMVKIGTTQNQRRLFYRLQKEKEMMDRLGMKQAVALLSGKMGVPADEIEEMSRRLSGRDVSLNQTVDDNDKSTLMDFQSSPNELNPDEQISLKEQLAQLKNGIEKIRPSLNSRELFLLEKRLLADEPMTLQEVGDHYKVTREAVRQMESRLLQKIRTQL